MRLLFFARKIDVQYNAICIAYKHIYIFRLSNKMIINYMLNYNDQCKLLLMEISTFPLDRITLSVFFFLSRTGRTFPILNTVTPDSPN